MERKALGGQAPMDRLNPLLRWKAVKWRKEDSPIASPNDGWVSPVAAALSTALPES
jgi:hypothetical protein